MHRALAAQSWAWARKHKPDVPDRAEGSPFTLGFLHSHSPPSLSLTTPSGTLTHSCPIPLKPAPTFGFLEPSSPLPPPTRHHDSLPVTTEPGQCWAKSRGHKQTDTYSHFSQHTQKPSPLTSLKLTHSHKHPHGCGHGGTLGELWV